MPTTFGGQLIQGAATNAVNAGMGLVLGGIQDRRQLKQQQKLLDQQQKEDREQALFQQGLQYDMWKRTGPVGQMEQYKKAGLNPALMYGMGGGGGQSMGQPTGNVNAEGAPRGGGEAMGMMQIAAQQAQIELLKAQAENTKADTSQKLGWGKENVEASTKGINQETENKILNGIMLKWTGKEMEGEYKVREGLRGMEEVTREAEFAARSGIAENIATLANNGQLENKSNYEIEQLLLQNAKTKEETRNIIKGMDLLEEHIKGAKLENIMKDLEMRLQTETGIDKNSAGWIKVLGRLFIQLMGGGISKIK